MSHLSDKSIKKQIRSLIFSSLVLTVGMIVFIILYYWNNSIKETMVYTQQETTQAVLQKIKTFIDIPLAINEQNRYFIENGLINIKDVNNDAKFFGSVMRSADDSVYSFSFGTADGEYYGVRSIYDQLEFMESNKYTGGKSTYYMLDDGLQIGRVAKYLKKFDPRTRDWYKAAVENKKPVFSDIYRHFVMNDLAISASYPIYNNKKELTGVLGTHITLYKLNNELQEIVKSRYAKAYIFEKNTGYLVANSDNKPNFTVDAAGVFHRISAKEIKDDTIKTAYINYQNNADDTVNTLVGIRDFYVKVSEYKNSGIDWILITAVPESPYVMAIKKSIWVSAVILLIILFIVVFFSSHKIDNCLQPIYQLIDISEKFSNGDFSKRAHTSQKNEIGVLGIAFNNMADHLETLINRLEHKVKERTIELEQQNIALATTKEKLENLLQIDFLTGLYNRRFLIEKLEASIEKFAKSNTVFAVFMLDIDFFKHINDKYGHDCGDFALKEAASIFKKCLQDYGYAARWGGEEFLVLLPQSDEQFAVNIAENIRREIENYKFLCEDLEMKITLTIGVAVYDYWMSVDEIVKHADIAVYAGKQNGRNRVELYK
ncbi:diguanylate cyclase [Pectinatus brassicae]|uniref:Diguanylate cyclase (GGDEF)-like protein n=1 Tax=Pectinatus brassicae TaxID=862415 RepID=A0A840UK94_9FIRM|nr:diguanylate cyclase [Pectinatus brassicae]MBB5337429.1 diguanylate cyclase (GGDEF)-like protein [Pectinatus brassicae]